VSLFLRRPSLQEDFLFDAADHAVTAREYGTVEKANEELVELLLKASSRAAISESFEVARRYLVSAQVRTMV